MADNKEHHEQHHAHLHPQPIPHAQLQAQSEAQHHVDQQQQPQSQHADGAPKHPHPAGEERRPSLLPSPFSRKELYEEDLSEQQKKHAVEYAKSNEHFTWYFAYGANMSDKVLVKRRGINPLETVPARLANYKLEFTHRGVAFHEPAFASVAPATGDNYSEVHGVLYRLKPADFDRVRMFEGVGGCYPHYNSVELVVQTYDNRQIWAHTLVTHNHTTGVLPSQRYLQIIKEGARLANLDKAYQDFLGDVPTFKPTCAHKTLLALTVFLSLPLLLLALLPALLIYGGRAPYLLIRVVQLVGWTIFRCCCFCGSAQVIPAYKPHPV